MYVCIYVHTHILYVWKRSPTCRQLHFQCIYFQLVIETVLENRVLPSVVSVVLCCFVLCVLRRMRRLANTAPSWWSTTHTQTHTQTWLCELLPWMLCCWVAAGGWERSSVSAGLRWCWLHTLSLHSDPAPHHPLIPDVPVSHHHHTRMFVWVSLVAVVAASSVNLSQTRLRLH